MVSEVGSVWFQNNLHMLFCLDATSSDFAKMLLIDYHPDQIIRFLKVRDA
jgi:hypothetical protein